MAETLTRQVPEEIIARERPGQPIEWLDGGDNRFVGVVGGTEAWRFAKEEAGSDANRYEFEALKLLQGKLTTSIPRPIALATDGSYNVLSFLPGRVLSKQAVTELSFEERRDLGAAIGRTISELNRNVSKEELVAIPTNRLLVRNRDDYYAATYQTAQQQEGIYSSVYRKNYAHLQSLRPEGSSSNIIVFGDYSSPNLVLSAHNQLIGLIDWTELGLGDIHNELRPVFSVIGQRAFDEMVESLDPKLGPINKDQVRLQAVVHELAVLVSGKQKGILTPERTKLAIDSLAMWLGGNWTS